MARITEQDLILPALYVISMQAGITTTELIAKLRGILNPIGEDIELLEGRNDDKFSQKVRNLVSHHRLDDRLGYTTLIPIGKNNSSHSITQNGLEYLQSNVVTLENLLSNSFSYSTSIEGIKKINASQQEGKKLIVLDENFLIKEGRSKTISTRAYERSSKLRDLAIKKSTQNGRILCQACGFDFLDFYGELGKGFIEVHHDKPIFLYEESDSEMVLSEALKNVRPLCSNCHRMIHRNKQHPLSVEELRNILVRQGKI